MLSKKWLQVLILTLFALLTSCITAFAAGSCVFTQDTSHPLFVKLSWLCTADSSGNVSSPTITGTGATQYISGSIRRAKITPGTGDDTPDTLYDVELRDSANANDDMLRDLGDDLSQTVPMVDVPLTSTNGTVIPLYNQSFTPFAANCGNGNKFTVEILVCTKVCGEDY